MLKLFTLCIDTCINSFHETVFYSVKGFSVEIIISCTIFLGHHVYIKAVFIRTKKIRQSSISFGYFFEVNEESAKILVAI